MVCVMFFHVASLICWQGHDQPFLEQKIALLKYLNHPNLVRDIHYLVVPNVDKCLSHTLCVCSLPLVR